MAEITSGGNGHAGNGTGDSGRNGGGKPRRAASRGMARWNALKHGVLSENAVLPTEDKTQYQELLKQLREDRQPQGALEELLVEKIAVCFWRLRRILLYDFGNYQGDIPGLVAAYVDADNRTKKLTNLRRELDEKGFTNDLKKRLIQSLGVNLDPSTVEEELLSRSLDEAIVKSQRSGEKTKTTAETLGLGQAIKSRTIDILLRYETSNERQLYRAIDQLERLQRQRAGDYVPPPVKVGVSTDV